jgi:GR25 family glycosyltransferase involved in LPS biosynthesis
MIRVVARFLRRVEGNQNDTAIGHMIPVYVINLPSDAERREHMAAQLGGLGLPYRLWRGIDGRAISPQDAKPYMDRVRSIYGRALTLGELGCALAHLSVAKQIVDDESPFACVMEDDIVTSPDALPFLEEETLGNLPPFDVLRLFSNQHRQHKLAWQLTTMNGRGIVAPFRCGWGMYAQVYSRNGAHRIATLPVTGPIDGALYYDAHVPGLRILEVRPSLIQLRCFESNTSGWQAWPQSPSLIVNERLLRPVSAWANFCRTWGMAGITGLIQSRYQMPP